MVALVSKAVADARNSNQEESAAFQVLSAEIDEYLEDSWGSGIDIPDWLRALEREVYSAVHPDEGGRPGMEAELDLTFQIVSREEFLQQTRAWRDVISADPAQSRDLEDETDPDSGPVQDEL
jgi:hypothetical protein